MPYASNAELPEAIQKRLPTHAQDIYRDAFNRAWENYRHDLDQEAIAHRIAWAAVKRTYRKVGGVWMPKSVEGDACDQKPSPFSAHHDGEGCKDRVGMPNGIANPQSDSLVLRCPYPDTLRSNPRCEALGTMSSDLPASKRAEARGRHGRLKELKTRRARHSEAAKEADRPQPKGNVGRTVGPVSAGGSTWMSHRVKESSLPMKFVQHDQLGKPHGPHLRVVSRPQGRGMGQGVKDAGESEGRPVIGRIGSCPSRQGAYFRRVSPKAMPLPCGTCRDVRR